MAGFWMDFDGRASKTYRWVGCETRSRESRMTSILCLGTTIFSEK